MTNEEWKNDIEQKLDALLNKVDEVAEESRRMFLEFQQAEHELDSASRRVREAVDTIREGDSGIWAAMEIAHISAGHGGAGQTGKVPRHSVHLFQR